MEFKYSNIYQATIGMAPYKALYGRKCRTLLCWEKVGNKKIIGAELVKIMIEKVKVIRDRMKVAQDR